MNIRLLILCNIKVDEQSSKGKKEQGAPSVFEIGAPFVFRCPLLASTLPEGHDPQGCGLSLPLFP